MPITSGGTGWALTCPSDPSYKYAPSSPSRFRSRMRMGRSARPLDAFEIFSLTGDIAPLCATHIFPYQSAFPVLLGCEAGDVMAKLRFDPSVPQVQGFADLTIR